MNPEEFEKLINSMTEEEKEIILKKGKEYTQGSEEDRLKNFNDLAKDLGLTALQVWSVYFMKHIHSILSYVKHGQTFSDESIKGRITDARVYLALGRAIIEEKEGKVKK